MSALSSLLEFKQFIIEALQLEGVRPDTIEDDQPLFGAGLGLDSIDALELVVALEQRVGLKIRAHEIEPTAFASVDALFQFVQRQIAAENP